MSTHCTRRRLAPCNGGVNQNVSQSGSTPQILGTCLDGSGGGTANGATIVRDRGGRSYQRWARG